ncbi:MAG: aryl-sulfate sulfotransferase [Deltaproteobacteria bacterium]|nr:aryl-sulfate sulfotransferase [Deltaproteobacteria bacterium]
MRSPIRPRAALALLLSACGAATAPDVPPDADTPDADTPDAASAAGDYLLLAPIASTTTYLIDRSGAVVHAWPSSARPGQAVYLLDDGDLLRTEVAPSTVFSGGGIGGRVTRYAWYGAIAWSYAYASATHQQHHDAIALPDGHVLLVAWETVPDALARGRDPAALPAQGELWADHLVEIDPATDAIVWEWHLVDHLVQDRDAAKPAYGAIAAHPELVDINAAARPQNDWTHVNAVAYDAAQDEILLSVHNLNEVWVLDHGTTAAIAAGHTGGRRGRGGDLLYRFGNPAIAGAAGEETLFGQHNAQWIAAGLPGAGHVLLFNNGRAGVRPYSTVDEYALPTDGAAPTLTWRYIADPPESMFGSNISGAQRLPDGNTLVCVGPEGRLLEVTPGGATVWSYAVPGAMPAVFRATRIAGDHPALFGRVLVPGGPIAN